MHSYVLALALVFAVGASHAADEGMNPPAAADPKAAPAAEMVPEAGIAPEAATSEAAPAMDAAAADPGPVTEAAASSDADAAAEPDATDDADMMAETDATDDADMMAEPDATADADTMAETDATADAETMAEAEAETPAVLRPEFDPRGTIHVVREGDTLWDISNLYLGTPWIWPSLWKDNTDIADPHLILPGDKIWVSASEMRKLTDAEAAALEQAAAPLPAIPAPVPAALAEDAAPAPEPEPIREVFEYWRMGTVGLVSDEELESLGRVVGTLEEQVLLTQGDVVFVDLGADRVDVGDRFTLFRPGQTVYDPSTREALGTHMEILGWLTITETYGTTSRARVGQAYADFVPGVYLRERTEEPRREVVIQDSPPGVEGQIADLLVDPKYRSGGDVVILNRGAAHGLQPGSPLEVYRPVQRQWKETWYGEKPDVEIPHEVVANLLVLSVEDHTAMALVRRSNTELWYGDHFRTVGGPRVDWQDEGPLTWSERVKRTAAQMPRPSMPDAVSDWNLPRLSLPELDGYDPR